MASRPSASRSTTGTVRRNLFQNPSQRRPNTSSSTEVLHASSDNSTNDIVVKDESGNFHVELPVPPAQEQDEENEQQKVDQRLIEHYRTRSQHQIEHAELRAAVQASLREKAASLEDDKWMYEPEMNTDLQG